jgi:NAD(P)-dependent dehydrogenase (short-subunit alcohol dehydrogenase family)
MRDLFTVIQRSFPNTFARIADDGGPAADVTTPDVAALAKVLPNHGVAPAWIHCGDHRVHLAANPHRLVGDAHGSSQGSLANHVTLVTGAASGLGLAIARGAYAAGSCVLLTDVDAAGLAAAAHEFDDSVRIHTAVLDVTDEAGVAAAFDVALSRWGRVDGLACCAGVAPSYPLVDFPLAKFRLANEINLTGYFLCAREFARIAIAQGHGGSMVFLSSKSGLEPSKSNTAYNATKAGELHMSRGWALELGRDGIRSNCIAPGNVFAGSKIWNADYIAAAAKKKGIRPDEVIPYYVGLTALNRDIQPSDIADTAVYLLSEASRCVTGQVMVVDAGQVFVR